MINLIEMKKQIQELESEIKVVEKMLVKMKYDLKYVSGTYADLMVEQIEEKKKLGANPVLSTVPDDHGGDEQE